MSSMAAFQTLQCVWCSNSSCTVAPSAVVTATGSAGRPSTTASPPPSPTAETS
uniref:Uncharacterized protein n=1 Tax=Arundo donax TaxID=35708 RepID=A0A0A9ACU5_ARUDO